MEWLAWPFSVLRTFFHPYNRKKVGSDDRLKPRAKQKKKLRKTPYYAHVRTEHIRTYQKYMDRAFALSPSLTFDADDYRFNSMLDEAVCDDGLSAPDLEIMRIQYLLADPEKREKYQTKWAVKVVNRNEDDFFPSPWAILSIMFTKSNHDILHEAG